MKRKGLKFLIFSFMLHGAVLGFIGHWAQPYQSPESFYFFDLVEKSSWPPSRLSLIQPRTGEKRQLSSAENSMVLSESVGSRGDQAPRAQQHWAGADRAFFRKQLFNHAQRNSPDPERARPAKEQLSAVDSSEPTPFLSAPGSAPEVVRQRQGEVLSRIGKDGDDSQPRPRAPWASLSEKKNTALASSILIPDLLDMAPASGDGQAEGAGHGSRAGRRGSPAGAQRGRALWLNSRDRRYLDYFQMIYRKVHPLWSFPKHLEVLLEQGDVLIRFTVMADGSVQNVKVLKSSGYRQFDSVVLAAIHKAAPFAPIPGSLGAKLDIIAPFEFSNPMIR